MTRTRLATIAAAALAAGAALAAAPSAQADVTLCYDVHVSIADQGGDEADCIVLPGDTELPGLPEAP